MNLLVTSAATLFSVLIGLSTPGSNKDASTCRGIIRIGSTNVDSVECIRRGETLFADLRALTEACGGYILANGSNIDLTLTGKTSRLTVGSPLVKLSDGIIRQLPTPVEFRDDRYYLEARSLVDLLNTMAANSLEFDSEIPTFKITLPASSKEKQNEKKRWALDLVVIDPGHGGKDPGAIGATGQKEKDVTLEVGLRLNKYLQSKGIKTIMTRSSDKFIALSERTSIANKSEGKLFISLHCNSAKQRKAEGVETYFLAPSKTERATRVALLENEAIRFEDSQDRYQELTEESYILMTMTQATFTHESEALAGTVQESISRKLGLKDRGVDQAGFYVLIGASMPSILFEMAFLSNKAEEKKLKDKSFRQQMAEGIGDSILKFLAEQEKLQKP